MTVHILNEYTMKYTHYTLYSSYLFFANIAGKIPCPVCSMFITKRVMKRHIRNQHENIETVSCDVCGSIFKNAESMKYHYNKFHKEQMESF